MEEHDLTENVDGIKFVYNSGIAEYMDGLQIDYEDSLVRKGFSLWRPNASC